MTQQSLHLFYSYSHKDELFREQLEAHLSLLKRQGLIKAWHDRKIVPGQKSNDVIDSHLASADIILLLISADFIASDYCWDIELAQSLDRHELGQACVIPIIVRPSDWKGAPFGKLQALPKDGKPITIWENTDEAWLDVATGIRTSINELLKQKERAINNHGIASVREFLMKEVDRIDVMFRSQLTISGIPTGFTELDEILSGLHPSELIVIASRPAMGKTSEVAPLL